MEYHQSETDEDFADKASIEIAHVSNSGNVCEDISKYQRAVEVFRKNLETVQERGDKGEVGKAYSYLGSAYHVLGQCQLAIVCHRKDLDISKELGDKGGIGRAHGHIGIVYNTIGQYQLAIECHQKHLEIATELGDKEGVGRAHGNMGNVYINLGQYQKAIECHRKHLKIAEELGDKEGMGVAYGSIGNVYNATNQYRLAIEWHRKWFDIAEELGNNEGIGAAQGNMGIAYNAIGLYQKAIECYQKHLEIAQELGDKGGVGRAQANMGIALNNIGQYQKAINCHHKHLEIAQEVGDKAGVEKAYANMGIAYNCIGQHRQAIECHGKHLMIAEKLEDKRGIRKAHGNMGNAYSDLGQYKEAIECHRKALEIAISLVDKRGIGYAHANMGNVYNDIGQYQKAIKCHRKHLEIAEELEDSGGVGKAHANMGNIYCNIGQYQKAIECHRKHLEIAEKLADKSGMSAAHGNMGNAYMAIGQYRLAVDCHRKHLNIAKELGDESGVGKALANIGNVYYSKGMYKKAIDCHHKHLEIAVKLEDKAGVGKAQGNMGNAYNANGQYILAIECHHKYLEIAKELGDKGGVGRAQSNLGNAYCSVGRYKTASDCHCKHLEIADELGDKKGVSTAQFNLGRCYKESDSSLASSFFAKSILSFHTVRRSGSYCDEFNTSLSNTFACAHKMLLSSLLSLKQVKSALLVSDSGKAKALFDLMKRSVDDIMNDALEKNFITPIRDISDNPCSKEIEALLELTLSKVIHLMRGGSIISYTYDDQDDLHAWVISKNGVFHKQWQTANCLSARTYLKTVNVELQEILRRNSQKILICSPEVKSFCGHFAKAPNVCGRQKLENNVVCDFENKLKNFRKINKLRESPGWDQRVLDFKYVKERYNLDSQYSFHSVPCKSSEENDADQKRLFGWYSLEMSKITQMRIDHRAEALGKYSDVNCYLEKLYSVCISPIEEYLLGSKILVVPDGSLFTVPFCALLNTKKEHLCETYSLQFTPALHILNSSLSNSLPELGHALFIGNPVCGHVKFGDQLLNVPGLPYASVEAKECSEYFGSEPLLEEIATKENVLSKMNDASIIHIAAHGDMDHANIFLAPNQGAAKPPREDDYLLTAKDVARCTLKVRLVVLSCCHSGRGQISAEGVVGIARSFLGAGARSVMVTLKEIRDKETKELMKLFYGKVCHGLSVCAALQEAMVELKTNYTVDVWEPFQIVGEDITLTKDEIEEIRRKSVLT